MSKRVLMYVAHRPSFLLASICLAIVTLMSYGAPYVSDFILHRSPTDQDLANNFAPWFSRDHILGTDKLGRDVLTRALYGGRTSLTIAISVAVLGSGIGVSLGLVAGYYGRWLDDIVNALLQIFRGVPVFFLLIALSTLFRPSVLGLILVLGLLGWTSACRQVRGLVFSVKKQDYVDAARAIGAADRRIIMHHVLPNAESVILVAFSFAIASAIITESGLSFLGFGVQPPTPSWGNMLSDAIYNMNVAPWLIIVPGTLITLTVYCIFMVTDGLRDALDPQLHTEG